MKTDAGARCRLRCEGSRRRHRWGGLPLTQVATEPQSPGMRLQQRYAERSERWSSLDQQWERGVRARSPTRCSPRRAPRLTLASVAAAFAPYCLAPATSLQQVELVRLRMRDEWSAAGDQQARTEG
eukprot:2264936-Pleurochrysis_carterae.AAC.1